jgi:hypothetical protein
VLVHPTVRLEQPCCVGPSDRPLGTTLLCWSIRPSAWNNSAVTGRVFKKFYVWEFFEKSVQNIQVSLKSDKSNWYFTWRPTYIRDKNHAKFFIEWEIFQAKFVVKLKTRILCSKSFLRAIFQKIKKICTPGQATDGNIKRRVRFACWITKATNTNSAYLILLACPQQQWSCERASFYVYTYIAL